jgi:hypothetical protein
VPSRYTSTGRAVALGGEDSAAWLALLQSSTTYAWDGVQGLSLAAWVDVVEGVSAAASGSGTTLGALNGRAAAVFNGAGWFRTLAELVPLATAYDFIVVFRRDGAASSTQIMTDGGSTATADRRMQSFHITPNGNIGVANQTLLQSDTATTIPGVLHATLNGGSSVIRLNGSTIASGSSGSINGLLGLTIGASRLNAGPFIGPIAHISIYHGARLANAATVAALAQAYYGI